MPDITIVYWRDIPAQVIVGGSGRGGRRGSKAVLPERFEQAIDRCAMKIGAKDSDAYLSEWRKVPAGSAEGDPDALARDTALRLEGEHGPEEIKALIANDGWATSA